MIRVLIYVLLFFRLGGLDAVAQDTADEKLNVKVKMLQSLGVVTAVSFWTECTGSMPVVVDATRCHPQKTIYLLWRQGGAYYIQQFDDCNNHDPKVISDTFMHLVAQNFSRIRKEEIKLVACYEIVGGKKQRDFVLRDHDCYANFEFYKGQQHFNKRFGTFEMDTKYLDDKKRNINYNYNQHTVLKQLDDLMRGILKSIKTNR